MHHLVSVRTNSRIYHTFQFWRRCLFAFIVVDLAVFLSKTKLSETQTFTTKFVFLLCFIFARHVVVLNCINVRTNRQAFHLLNRLDPCSFYLSFFVFRNRNGLQRDVRFGVVSTEDDALSFGQFLIRFIDCHL